jgi:UDP-GlcNAc:undecaprenyl-phosphate/decaprenyl-phosphate GlcNAc-1-phosphate transferase
MISDFTLGLVTAFAALIALAIGLCAPAIGRITGLLDRPGGRKMHKATTPLMGGLALLVGLVPILAIYMLTYEPEGIGHWALANFVVAMIGCSLLGMLDDRFNIPARPRFALAFLLFGALLVFEPRFGLQLLHFQGFESHVALGWVGGWFFTVFVLLGFMNAVNMADGKNGLVIGLSIIWSLVVMASGPIGLIPVLVPLAALLGVLFVFNMSGRLFLGDGGTYGLSAIIGLAATYSYNFQNGLMAADQLILLFLVPITDMMRLIAHRLWAGRSPMSSDREHLHHYLLAGFGWPGGLIFYLLLVGAPNAATIWWPWMAPWFVLGTLIIYFVLIWGFTRKRERAVSEVILD